MPRLQLLKFILKLQLLAKSKYLKNSITEIKYNLAQNWRKDGRKMRMVLILRAVIIKKKQKGKPKILDLTLIIAIMSNIILFKT